jgi:hypothetical protein
MTIPQSRSAESVPWARQPSVTVPRKTDRSRQIVTTLPSWDPLPPGEILVRRGDQS